MFMPGLRPGALGASVHGAFAAAVHDLGHDFQILTTGTNVTNAELPFAEVLPAPRTAAWGRVDAAAAPWLRTRTLLSSSAALAQYLRDASGIDLLHVEVAYPFGAAAMFGAAAARWPGPIAITPMGEDTLVVDECHYGFRRFRVPRLLVNRVLGAAACIRSISPLHDRFLARLAPRTPRRVIPLNVSTAVVEAARESAESRVDRRRTARAAVDAELGLGGRPIVLSLGRLHPFKGLDLLLGAVRQMPDTTLLIAGPSLRIRATGDERVRLARLARELNLSDRVRFLGATTPAHALQLLAAADVLAVPSRLESLNKVCVEATAVGTPFVVTETTGISEWARKASLGVVIPPSDQNALAAALAAVLRRAPSPSAVDVWKFVEQFSPRTVAAAVIDFYQETLRSG
jgi:glycosyltransferase involved in cell wall biosynthesis